MSQLSTQIEVKSRTITAVDITSAAAAVADAALDKSAINPQDALTEFAAAIGVKTPEQIHDDINSVASDADGAQEFLRAWVSAQHDNNSGGKVVSLRTYEQVLELYRQWQPVLAKMVSEAAPLLVTDLQKLTAMGNFILANP